MFIFTVHGRGFMNGEEGTEWTQLTLVGHMIMTTWDL